jgi:uncharacterized protein (DUF983 family)
MSRKSDQIPVVSSLAARWSAVCPRCGQGKLFDGFLALRKKCEACGLDYGFADTADGPAVFVMLVVGFIVVGGALAVEILYQPPYWLHGVLWLPLALILSLLMLRPLKAWMMAQQYRHKAEEGRLARD